MGRATFVVLVFSLLIIISSCTSVNYVRVQLAQPSKEELPKDIQSILLVNRAVDTLYQNYIEDSLQVSFYRQTFNVDTLLYDSLAADTTMRALGELLYESGRYDIVIPENRFLPHEKNKYFSTEMSWEEVSQLCSDFNTDVVLSLDHLGMRATTQYSRETLYDRLNDRYFKGYFARMAVRYSSLFRVYDPLKKEVVNRAFLSDTLVWEEFGMSNRELFGKMTSVKDALVETGISIALDYSGKLAPSWKTDTRMYYLSTNEKFVQAHHAVQSNDWEKALTLWKEVSENEGSKSLISKAQFNAAVTHEILGNFDKAYEWGTKSYKTQYKAVTYNYLLKLKQRREQLKRLNK